MSGRIRIGSWRRFTAIQVIRPGSGMVWTARTRMMGLPVRGFDRLLDCRGETRWRLLGLIPVAGERDLHTTRSAAGRMAAELVWLPHALFRSGVSWVESGPDLAQAALEVCGEPCHITIRTGREGALKALTMKRWGDPDGRGHRYADFGCLVLEESRFCGVAVPSRLRVGWFFDGEGFAQGGEFIGVHVSDARFA